MKEITKPQWNSINNWMKKVMQKCEDLKKRYQSLKDLGHRGRKLIDDGNVEYEQMANVLECVDNMCSMLYANLDFFQDQAEILHYHMRMDYDYETAKAETEEETEYRHKNLFNPYIPV